MPVVICRVEKLETAATSDLHTAFGALTDAKSVCRHLLKISWLGIKCILGPWIKGTPQLTFRYLNITRDQKVLSNLLKT